MKGIIGFTRQQFTALDNLLSDILQRLGSVEGVTTEITEQAIGNYIEAHGVEATYVVTNGDLTISIG